MHYRIYYKDMRGVVEREVDASASVISICLCSQLIGLKL